MRRSPALLFPRALARSLPVVGRLAVPGRRGAGTDAVLTLKQASIDRERLAAYDRVCGFALSDRVPATFPHVLAFPLHLALMSDPAFPFAPIGLVHIHNRIRQHRPLGAAERLALRVRCSPVAAHPRGCQFALLTEARSAGELVWEEACTILHRRGGQEGATAPSMPPGAALPSSAALPANSALPSSAALSANSALPSSAALPANSLWRLPGDLGRRYAAVSGDCNPIHLHPLSARLLGFPAAIAHGMWTKARCLAALSPRLPDAFEVQVAFRRPILLPATVHFAAGAPQRAGELEAPDPHEARIVFGVRAARDPTPHLDGYIASL